MVHIPDAFASESNTAHATISIFLPDGKSKTLAIGSTVLQLAQSIASSLGKACLAGIVDGQVVDASYPLNDGQTVEIVTEQHPAALEIIRHSCAHLLAYAVQTLYPHMQVTIGPVIDDGFYYDFAGDTHFSTDDLIQIEAKMHELAKRNETVTRHEWTRAQTIAFFQEKGEHYKVEIIQSIPDGETISVYEQGAFTDVCRGPHVPSLGKLKVFKLMKVAGAYWRGDAKNAMLQRIYGTAWLNQADQDAYIYQIEEAKKRDHRKLGTQLDLFHFQDEAPGLVFWHPLGWCLWQIIEQYMRKVYQKNDYQEVRAPQILDRQLWQKSGHWDNYQDNMFTTESENRHYALKPMNCPGHVQIYNANLHSYRELPLRYGEFGQCHRNESSGALHGLMRVRGFTQDDGHIFCTEDQIQAEVHAFCEQAFAVYQDFGFDNVRIKLALRPAQRVGDDALWDKAEYALHQALQNLHIDYDELPGEGAFYGPKIEFHIRDAIGRSWQCGTIQVDFSMPIRLDATFTDFDNQKKTPVMLHRAILGSMERFIGILLENHAGKLPLWLAPVQVVVASISDDQVQYAQDVFKTLQAQGVRVKLDLRHEKIQYKIREHTLQKIPYIVVLGKKEQEEKLLTIRAHSAQDAQTNISIEAFLAMLH